MRSRPSQIDGPGDETVKILLMDEFLKDLLAIKQQVMTKCDYLSLLINKGIEFLQRDELYFVYCQELSRQYELV